MERMNECLYPHTLLCIVSPTRPHTPRPWCWIEEFICSPQYSGSTPFVSSRGSHPLWLEPPFRDWEQSQVEKGPTPPARGRRGLGSWVAEDRGRGRAAAQAGKGPDPRIFLVLPQSHPPAWAACHQMGEPAPCKWGSNFLDPTGKRARLR